MKREEIEKIIPHREPMLLVDEVYVNEDGSATGYYTVRGDEYFLTGHFPGNPIVPGVILCEIMAQASCVLFQGEMKQGTIPVYTGIDKVRFKGMVKPGDTIQIEVKIKDDRTPFYFMHGELIVNEKVCVRGDFSFAILS